MSKTKLDAEWVKLAGEYEKACNAVRVANWDSSVTSDEYLRLVEARETAFAKLAALRNR